MYEGYKAGGEDAAKAPYTWLEEYEAKTGGRSVAFAYNGNLSNGWMFPTDDTYHGSKVDEEYVQKRAK